MNEFQLQAGEQILRENEHALWMKSNLYAKSGRLILTDRRLVFVQAATALHTHGLLGYLVGLGIKRLFPALNGGVKFDIPLRAIMVVTKDTFGLNEMVSLVYSGQDKVRFGIGKGKFQEWETALSMARGGVKKAA